jgi:hypothetical protein
MSSARSWRRARPTDRGASAWPPPRGAGASTTTTCTPGICSSQDQTGRTRSGSTTGATPSSRTPLHARPSRLGAAAARERPRRASPATCPPGESAHHCALRCAQSSPTYFIPGLLPDRIGHRRVSPARRPFFMTLHKRSIPAAGIPDEGILGRGPHRPERCRVPRREGVELLVPLRSAAPSHRAPECFSIRPRPA